MADPRPARAFNLLDAALVQTPPPVEPRHEARPIAPSRRFALFAGVCATVSSVLPLASISSALAASARPFDEATRDPALARVRKAVLAAAKARDFAALAPHLDPALTLSFGGTKGRDTLAQNLRRTPALWDQLAWAVEHGGKFTGADSFWAPYAFHVATGKIDAFNAGVVVAAGVSARVAARGDAAVVATYSHDVVHVENWHHSGKSMSEPFFRRTDWLEIRTRDGRKAFIEARFVRSVVDYRVEFARSRGTWRVAAFLAGD